MEPEILKILKSISPESDFVNSRNFLEDGLIDSFDVVLITTALEEAFAISIPGEQIVPENYASLDQLTTLVSRCAGSLP